MEYENNNSAIPQGFARHKLAGCVHCTGLDALSFLQGQVTQELRLNRSTDVGYGLFLSQKGKVVGDSFLVRISPEDVWLLSYGTPSAVLRERLEPYVIADDVVLEDLAPTYGLVTFLGSGAAAWLAAQLPDGKLPQLGSFARVGQSFVFAGRRGVVPAWEWVGPESELPAPTLDRLDMTAMDAARVRAGIPAIPAELGPTDLPNEGGLEEIAVSYTKGCYLGQEVMARLKAMGQVRRRLLPVVGTARITPPALPTAIYQAEKRVGELRSWVQPADQPGCGMAMLTLLALDRSRGLSLEPAGPEVLQLLAASS